MILRLDQLFSAEELESKVVEAADQTVYVCMKQFETGEILIFIKSRLKTYGEGKTSRSLVVQAEFLLKFINFFVKFDETEEMTPKCEIILGDYLYTAELTDGPDGAVFISLSCRKVASPSGKCGYIKILKGPRLISKFKNFPWSSFLDGDNDLLYTWNNDQNSPSRKRSKSLSDLSGELPNEDWSVCPEEEQEPASSKQIKCFPDQSEEPSDEDWSDLLEEDQEPASSKQIICFPDQSEEPSDEDWSDWLEEDQEPPSSNGQTNDDSLHKDPARFLNFTLYDIYYLYKRYKNSASINGGKKWTKKRTDELMDLFYEGKSPKELADCLGRSERAIRKQIKQFQKYGYAGNRKQRKKRRSNYVHWRPASNF